MNLFERHQAVPNLGHIADARSSVAIAPATTPGPADVETRAAVAGAVRAGLLRRRKRLPPWLLYDHAGSALFEEITRLPEYYLTRAEHQILSRHAADITGAVGTPVEVIELGAGSASKTRLLLEALLGRQPRVRYCPVDVSPAALAEAAGQLARYRRLDVVPVAARYPEELGFLDRPRARRLVLFLGSNIGNYNPPQARVLLSRVRRRLAPGDAFLIGVDRRKGKGQLVPAYDDAAGVSARFNKNLLARINRELGGGFELDRFRHVALWNPAASRIELYLESAVAQRVPVRALGADVGFAAGERIHTESSYKLTDGAVRALFAEAGLVLETTWRDERRQFGLHLARVPERGRRATRARAATGERRTPRR